MKSLAAALLLCQPAAAWTFSITGHDWHLAAFEESLDLSAIASADLRHCLVASDESFYLQPGQIDLAARRIESRRPIPLIPTATADPATEIDLEGLTWSAADAAYYATGSHGLGKKKGDVQPARTTLYQIPFRPATGVIDPHTIRSASLLPILEKIPAIAPFLRQPLQQNGLNIEGVTTADGRLFFGLRAPNLDGRAFVIEADPAAIFDGKNAAPTVHPITLGPGRGIREIAAVREGFLILSGNASAEASKKFPQTLAPGPDDHFELFHWDPATGPDPTRLGALPKNGGKAEGLLILQDTPHTIACLVIFDGLAGGAPATIRLTRPAHSPKPTNQ